MRLKKKMFGIILSLALVLGLMPGTSLTAYAESEETLLTTITPTSQTTYSETTSGVVTVSQNSSYYTTSTHTWLWEEDADTVEVSGCEGYTITKVIFKYLAINSVTVSDAPFQLHFDDIGSSITCRENVGGEDFYGVSSIEVYGHANQTTVAVTSVSLNKNSTTLTVGGTETLTATVNPDDATDKTVTWSSDNTSVATVDANGKVTAVAKGTANITVTATNGTEDTSDDKKATCVVKVNAASSSGDSSDSGSGSSSGGSSDSGNTSGGTSSGSSDTSTTDTSAKVPYDDVAISTGSVNDITGTASATAESNPFETKIENNDNLTTLLALTPEEVAQGVNVWLDIQDMSDTVPQADKDIVQNASANSTVGMYLDINLFKKVGGNIATKITETNGTVKASILIPESLWKSGRTFEIIRVHDGVATAIEGTYDENTHVFTFETDKFSTYALAYKDQASLSGSGTTSDSGASNSSNNTQSSTPKTGDPNDIRVWYLFLLASLGGLGFLGYSKKKEN